MNAGVAEAAADPLRDTIDKLSCSVQSTFRQIGTLSRAIEDAANEAHADRYRNDALGRLADLADMVKALTIEGHRTAEQIETLCYRIADTDPAASDPAARKRDAIDAWARRIDEVAA